MKKLYAFAAAAMVAVAANAQNLYIAGGGAFPAGEWNAETPDEFELTDGGYVFEVADLTQFKISTACGSWDDFNAGALFCNYGKVPGATVALEAGDANIAAPWKGDYKIVVSLDLATITLTTDTPEPTEAVKVYLRGTINSWGAEEAWEMTNVGTGLYKFEFAEGQAIKTDDNFKIADADWNEINVGGDGEPLILDTEIEVFNGGNPANFEVAEEVNGVVWFVLDYDGASYIALSNDKSYVPDFAEGDGVAAVEVADEAPVYYNLQGVRVANPTKGIYVKVVGNKALKAVVK